jgi:sulfite exporter TauE/SafE
LAVQGGLLASSVASQAEDDFKSSSVALTGDAQRGTEYGEQLAQLDAAVMSGKQYKTALAKLKHRYPKQDIAVDEAATTKHVARPIALFLASKLVAYTILGLLLGWLGSALQLTPYMRAAVQIATGIFMLGTALRMFNVHPIFRYFSIEPPKAITRYIRRKAKHSDGQFVTPVFLGALTVLIPCGITTAMMALAIGSGNPVAGALIMAAFIIGTSPVFFSLAYFATKLGERFETKFLKFTGAVILVLGLVSVEGGLNLAGSPVSFTTLMQAVASRNTPAAQESAAAPGASVSVPAPSQDAGAGASAEAAVLTLAANSSAYSPSIMQAKAGTPYTLQITSQSNTGCGRSLVIPSLGIQKTLPQDGMVTVAIPAQKAGILRITCVMGMYNSRIQFN